MVAKSAYIRKWKSHTMNCEGVQRFMRKKNIIFYVKLQRLHRLGCYPIVTANSIYFELLLSVRLISICLNWFYNNVKNLCKKILREIYRIFSLKWMYTSSEIILLLNPISLRCKIQHKIDKFKNNGRGVCNNVYARKYPPTYQHT